MRPILFLMLVSFAAACGAEPVPLAPQAEKLVIEAPKSKGAERYMVDTSTGKLGFDMDAPFEKIRGRVPAGALTGEIFFDPGDITRTTGLVHVDLRELELFQRASTDDGKTFGEEVKNDTQNEHARAWLEISPDTPEDQLAKNSLVEFSLREIKQASATDLSKLAGADRSVTLTAVGEFLLHQRKATKEAKLEVIVHMSGDAPSSISVRSLEPLEIGLDEYDVRPRTGFSKLAAKTLQTLAPKVAKAAQVNIEFTAKLAPGAKPTMQSRAAEAPAAGSGASAPSPVAPAPATP